MDLTDFELEAIYEILYDLLYDQYFYGLELVYQETDEAKAVGEVLTKARKEAKKRELWWGE